MGEKNYNERTMYFVHKIVKNVKQPNPLQCAAFTPHQERDMRREAPSMNHWRARAYDVA